MISRSLLSPMMLKDTGRKVLIAVLAVCVVGGLLVGAGTGLALAQAEENETGGAGNDTGPEAPGSPFTGGGAMSPAGGGTGSTGGTDSGGAGGEGAGTNETGGTGGGGGGGGGPGDVFGDVADTASSIAQNPAQTAANATLGPIVNFIVGVPTIDIGIFEDGPIHAPTNWPSSALFAPVYYGVFLPLTIVSFTGILVASFGMLPLSVLVPGLISTYSATSRIGRAMLACISIPAHLMFFSMERQGFSMLIEEIAPTPGEMIAEMGLFEFALSAAVTGMGLYELGWDSLKYAGILYAAIWLWIAAYPMVSLPFTTAYVYNPRAGYGRFGMYTFVLDLSMLLSKLASAVLLYTSVQLEWGAHFEGIVNALLSIAMIWGMMLAPLLITVFVVLSKNKVMAMISGGLGAAAGSTIAQRARENEFIQNKAERTKEIAAEKKESGKDYARRGTKRAAAKTQGTYWDAKNRLKGAAAVGARSPSLAAAAGKERIDHWRASRGNGGTEVTNAEEIRNMEQTNGPDRDFTATQRRRYFDMAMEKQGVRTPRQRDRGGSDMDSRTETDGGRRGS